MLVLLKIINSVFSSIILNALEVIHLITSNMQFCNLMMAALIAAWWLSHWRYIWVSSAYVWYWRPCRWIIVVNGYTYIVYNRAPKTEPCGTPQLASRDSEKTSFTHTLLSLLLKNDSNHWSTVPSMLTTLDCSIWTAQSGLLNLDLSIWIAQSGPLNLDLSIWTYQSGSLNLDRSIWTAQSGPLNLDRSIWTA